MQTQVKWAILSSAILAFVQIGCAEPMENPEDRYLTAVKTCMDNLIKYGKDDYGAVQSPIFVSILNVEERSCPRTPLALDENWRVIRRERRNPAGANLLSDQALLRTMYAVSRVSGQDVYAGAAERYIDYYLKNLVDKKGFIWWGWHRHYDVYEDVMTGHEANWHEVHANSGILWETLWKINPDVVKNEIEATWKWQVFDKKTGEINRHDDGCRGCDFTLTAGAIIESFAFMYSKSHDSEWLDRARVVAGYYWNLRDPQTNLLPERPNAGRDRFDGGSFVTNTTGPYCHGLLKAYQLTGDEMFKEHAVAYLTAYDKYGFDPASGKYWGALKLDGKPIPGPRVLGGYEEAEPRGYLDLWEPYVLGYQYPLETAQSYALAYRVTKNPQMLTAAVRFADWIEKTPTNTNETEVVWYAEYKTRFGSQGTYADKYGRTISLYLELYDLTEQPKYLQLAQKFADEALEKLYVNGFFKGHPAKPYYESVDGVGNLLYALATLDSAVKGKLEGSEIDNW